FPDLFTDGKHFRAEHSGDQTNRDLEQVARSLLGFVFDHHVVDARLAGVTRLAVISADVCKRCEFDRNMLDNVTEVSSFFESLHEAATPSNTAMVIIQTGQTTE